MKEEQEDKLFEDLIQNANNFGEPIDMYHPDHGQILKDGKPTKQGLKFFKKQIELCKINLLRLGGLNEKRK